DNGAVKMQGHRGLSGLYADNTIPGFTAAAQKGYWGIETDVQVTKDGVFVLCHDSNLSEIAGVDMDVAYTNYEDLKAVNLLNREGVPEEGLYIPTLAEYLDICKAYGAYAVIELKATFTDEQCAELVQLVKDKGMFESAMFTSFKQDWLLQVKAVDANATLMLITQVAETLEEKTAWMIENGIHANLGWDLVTEEVIQTFHDAGLLVCSGAGDYYNRFEYLMQFDVDIIGSDIFV
ncbi:MAG: hypothetical protein IJD33_04945, partial [Clostridia bacterium]|nr:hypothetical protein [Clostridia bacterium]